MATNLFDALNWVLKNKKEEPSDLKVYPFLFNRWLSMVDNDTINIINSTTNRWLLKNKDFPFVDFYRAVLPKNNERINYIKKEAVSTSKDSDVTQIAENMELSTREIIFLQKSLEDLKQLTN